MSDARPDLMRLRPELLALFDKHYAIARRYASRRAAARIAFLFASSAKEPSMLNEPVTFHYALGDRITERQTGITGPITVQSRDSRGIGYYIVWLDGDGQPHDRFVADPDALPAQTP